MANRRPRNLRQAAGGRGDPGRQRRKSVHSSNKGEECETLFDPPGPMTFNEALLR
jgi:hypothetical protein